ncbi:hypothetical protein [Glycomyces xiaoerkulensis]|uniref:hypothetical protein n=1 Tax=Glycomyces xiaoerkulensis TaxID=2038139 RepID=UPI000DEEA2D0|nr:hypothetical protein [Glycomyces xiaoerkulensis]
MPTSTTRRLAGAVAVPAFALALAACSPETSSDSEDTADEAQEDDAAAQLSPHETVLASYEGLDSESYKMESSMTVDDIDFMDMTSVSDGESARSSQDMYMSAIMEAMGEDMPDDPEANEMMETMFSDMHSESIIVDDVIYMQFSGGMFAMLAEDFGEDAWFTLDLNEQGELSELYQEFGSFDLAEQTELMLEELGDVEETGDGVYTGTLSADSEAMETMMGATGAGANGAEFAGETELTVTIDDRGLLESMEMTLPEIEGMTMRMVSEIVEIGGDYDISVPDSDNIHPFEDFAMMGG